MQQNFALATDNFRHRIYGLTACPACGDLQVAPERSEHHVDAKEVRHLWACDSCGYAFQTAVTWRQ